MLLRGPLALLGQLPLAWTPASCRNIQMTCWALSLGTPPPSRGTRLLLAMLLYPPPRGGASEAGGRPPTPECTPGGQASAGCQLLAPPQGLMHSSGPVGRHRQLVLVLEGDLYLIPFALLKGSSSNEYLYERFALIAVPSIRSLSPQAKVSQAAWRAGPWPEAAGTSEQICLKAGTAFNPTVLRYPGGAQETFLSPLLCCDTRMGAQSRHQVGLEAGHAPVEVDRSPEGAPAHMLTVEWVLRLPGGGASGREGRQMRSASSGEEPYGATRNPHDEWSSGERGPQSHSVKISTG